MIELLDLSSDESIGNATSINDSHTSSGILVPHEHNESNDTPAKYTPINIKQLLKEKPEKYVLVDNPRVNQNKPSACWHRFALPAVKDENNITTIIKNFATCRTCYTTYMYTLGSTKSLNSHKCLKEQSLTSPLISKSNSPLSSKTNRILIEKKKVMTSLIALWVSQSMRPVNIVEDKGFTNIIQQCLIWSGGAFSNASGNDIIPSRPTITREIKQQADDIRQRLGVKLRDAAKQGFLSISPDLWSDKFNQNSYLGLTAHFVEGFNLYSIDLCCEPYHELNKRGDNVRKVIVAALSRFGLDNYMNQITFVCDRGSNIIKALDGCKMVHCFPHRLNNILKRTFYSAGTREKLQKRKQKQTTNNNQNDSLYPWNDSIGNDDDSLMDDDDRDSNDSDVEDDFILNDRTVELALRGLVSPPEVDHINILEQDLPYYANQILTTIVHSKQLCRYVKRVNWNPLLQEAGKPTIKQEVIVRWLSMSQLLESVLASYSTLTNIASEKGTLHVLPSVDVTVLAAIVDLFSPWKEVMQHIQATNKSSLHIVITSYWYLLESLVVTKNEAADKSAKGVVFFKIRARQLLKAMFNLEDEHWIAGVLNPRTRMLKMATDIERSNAHTLVRKELEKIIQLQGTEDHHSTVAASTKSPLSTPRKKFKSFTMKFDDDNELFESNNSLTTVKRARQEFELYLQFKLTNSTYSKNDNDDPLIFWKDQEQVFPNLSILARKVFCIPASSAAVERSFSSAGNIISQRRTSISPSTVNDMILVRSAATNSLIQL